MKLAHFSDLHLHEAFGDTQLEVVLELISDAAGRGAEHLVFSGDLVEHANLDDLRRFVRELRGLGWADPESVSFVPGNHDIFPVSPTQWISLDGTRS